MGEKMREMEECKKGFKVPDADGWIEWKGWKWPVGEGDRIDVKFSDGDTLFDVDSNWDWGGDVDMCNIIAYRLHKPEQSTVETRLADAVDIVKAAAPALMSDEMKFTGDEVMGEIKPTLDQLLQDWRSADDFAKRKQREADDAKADADEKLRVLEIAGESLGLLVSPITEKQEPEHELVITDWRDLRVGDVVWYDGDDELSPGEYHVMEIEVPDYEGYRTVLVNGCNGGHWIDTRAGWRLIRRP